MDFPEETSDSQQEYLIEMDKNHSKKSVNRYICSDCGKQLKTKSELKWHTNSKCGTVRLFKCKICNQELMTPGSLHNHMLRHNGKRSFMCKFCAKMFLTAGQLKVHERKHTQEKVYVCQVCGKGFCHRQSLCTHTTLHTGIKPYQCEHCGSSFSCIGNLMKHRKTHPDTCGLFPLNSHRVNNPTTKLKVKINTPENTKLKSINAKSTTENTSHDVQKPLATETDKCLALDAEDMLSTKLKQEDIFEDCYNIEKTMCKEEMETLLLNDYLNQIDNTGEESFSENSFECSDQSITINNSKYDDLIAFENDLSKEHSPGIQVEHEDIISLSEICSDSLIQDNFENVSTPSNIEDKVTSSNKGNSFSIKKLVACKRKRKNKKIDSEYKVFITEKNSKNGVTTSCSYCGKKYNNMKWLFKHEKEHKEAMGSDTSNTETKSYVPYKCSCCKMSFSTKSECRTHQTNVHSDILSCQECDRIFANLDSLKAHQNRCHKGIPRKTYLYNCKKCGTQFKQKAHLVLHEENNCGESPQYECDICKKQFMNIHTRQAHMKVHYPEKKLLCKYCGKSFHWKGQLKIHERSHTGEKPYTCLYCPKAFAYRESLITHSSVHTGIKPYLCEACGWRFSCIGNLVKHRNSHASTCGAWYSKNQTT